MNIPLLYFGCRKEFGSSGHTVYDPLGNYIQKKDNKYAEFLANHDGQLAPINSMSMLFLGLYWRF